MAIGTLYGIGGTSVISRAFGERKDDYARRVSSFCFYASLFTGILFIILFYSGMDMILSWVGASTATRDYVRVYLECVTWSAPFVILSTAFSNIIRAEGRSMEATTGMMAGTIVNIVLDPILISVLDMGIEGAAWATVAGNLLAATYYWIILIGKKSQLSIAWKDLRPDTKLLKDVFAIGIPASLNSIMMSISNIVLNLFLSSYGDISVAAMGVAMKANMVVVLLLIGLGQGIQPLLGYCYGSEKQVRFKRVIRFSNVLAVAMGTFLTAGCYLFAEEIIRIFIDSSELFEHGVLFLRILLTSGPFLGILFVYNNALQAVGAARDSLLLSLSRQGFIFLPCLVIFNRLFHLGGLVVAQPVADILSCLIAYLLFRHTMRQRSQGKESRLQLLSDQP